MSFIPREAKTAFNNRRFDNTFLLAILLSSDCRKPFSQEITAPNQAGRPR